MASKGEGAKTRTKKWKWSEEMVKTLLRCIKEYKSAKEFEGVDFEADLVVFYEEIRKIMAGSFEGFGPVKLSESSSPLNELNESQLKKFNDMIKLEKSDVKKGYDRVKEKIKVLRQDYRTALNLGTRSGSGRIIRDNWDDLTEIWAGSPATKAIDNACTSREVNNENIGDIPELLLDEDVRDIDPLLPLDLDESESVNYGVNSHTDQHTQENKVTDDSEDGESQLGSLKRSLDVNPTPKFVDNKRRKMEKQLSAKQREMVMINAAKKEIELKTSIAHGLLDSNKNINSAMSKMADSISSLGNGLLQGFGLIAQALTQNQQPLSYPVQGMVHPMVQFNPGNHYQPRFEMENRRQSVQRNQVLHPPSGDEDLQ